MWQRQGPAALPLGKETPALLSQFKFLTINIAVGINVLW
jgi:hypothetical protein